MTYFDLLKQQFNVFVYAVFGRTAMIFFLENFTREKVPNLEPAAVFGYMVGIIFIGAYIRYWYYENEV
jgi:hypothetical protein